MQLSLGANLEVRQLTASQQKMQDRCAASQQRQMAKDPAAGGLRSLSTAQGYLDRWGREKIACLGCMCADFRPAGEDVDHRCPSHPICPGQQGGPRIPDLQGGCHSIGAAAWILQPSTNCCSFQWSLNKSEMGWPPSTGRCHAADAANGLNLPCPISPPLLYPAPPSHLPPPDRRCRQPLLPPPPALPAPPRSPARMPLSGVMPWWLLRGAPAGRSIWVTPSLRERSGHWELIHASPIC